jgi:hypothetical protein
MFGVSGITTDRFIKNTEETYNFTMSTFDKYQLPDQISFLPEVVRQIDKTIITRAVMSCGDFLFAGSNCI